MSKIKLMYVDNNFEVSDNVAVVGSSPDIFLTNKDYLKKIDQHEDVIRFNLAKTEGYSEFVGSKTTIRTLSNVILSERFNENKTTTKLIKNNQITKDDLLDLKKSKNKKFLVYDTIYRPHSYDLESYHKSNSFHFVNPDAHLVFRYLYGGKFFSAKNNKMSFLYRHSYTKRGSYLNLFNKNIFTSGLFMILLLVHSGIKPNVYGFSRVIYKSNSKLRWYYRNTKHKNIKSVSHDWSLEKKILRLLTKYRLINKIE